MPNLRNRGFIFHGLAKGEVNGLHLVRKSLRTLKTLTTHVGLSMGGAKHLLLLFIADHLPNFGQHLGTFVVVKIGNKTLFRVANYF